MTRSTLPLNVSFKLILVTHVMHVLATLHSDGLFPCFDRSRTVTVVFADF